MTCTLYYCIKHESLILYPLEISPAGFPRLRLGLWYLYYNHNNITEGGAVYIECVLVYITN